MHLRALVFARPCTRLIVKINNYINVCTVLCCTRSVSSCSIKRTNEQQYNILVCVCFARCCLHGFRWQCYDKFCKNIAPPVQHTARRVSLLVWTDLKFTHFAKCPAIDRRVFDFYYLPRPPFKRNDIFLSIILGLFLLATDRARLEWQIKIVADGQPSAGEKRTRQNN